MKRVFALLACAALLSSAAADAAPAPTTPDQQAEHWLRVGYDRTDLALTALRRADASTPAQARLWLRTRAWVAARSGRASEL